MSFGSRVPQAIRVSPGSPARNACATPVPGGRATTDPCGRGASRPRSSCTPEVAPAPSAANVRLDVTRRDDHRRPLPLRFGPDELGLAVPGVTFLDLDVARARPHAATARQLARRQVFARAERDHVTPLLIGSVRVRL